jgi:hypothetical protein
MGVVVFLIGASVGATLTALLYTSQIATLKSQLERTLRTAENKPDSSESNSPGDLFKSA